MHKVCGVYLRPDFSIALSAHYRNCIPSRTAKQFVQTEASCYTQDDVLCL